MVRAKGRCEYPLRMFRRNCAKDGQADLRQECSGGTATRMFRAKGRCAYPLPSKGGAGVGSLTNWHNQVDPTKYPVESEQKKRAVRISPPLEGRGRGGVFDNTVKDLILPRITKKLS